jgi:TolA-binding protein
MNDNTILRIKVPAHLYESVKKQLTLTEAKKGGHNYGAGMEVVKEKKMSIPPDGMKKVKGEVKDDKNKGHSLEELKDAHKKLSGKIEEMENTSINKADDQQASVEEIAAAMDKAVAFAKKLAQQIANKKGGSLTQKDFFRLIDNFRSKVKDFGPFKRD